MLHRILTYVIATFASVAIFFPFYWMFAAAVREPSEIFAYPPPLFPQTLTLKNFETLFSIAAFPVYYYNSIIVATGTVVITVALSILGGYGATRFDFRGKETIASMTLLSYMFPPIVIGVPMYVMFTRIGLIDSYLGLMLSHTTLSLPFSLWLMWQFFKTVPISYEESAWILGASRFRAFKDIALPMAFPGIVASAIFTFALSWSDYTYALILINHETMKTLPLGLSLFIERAAINWDLMETSSTLVALPGLLIVLFLQKYLLRGFSLSLKG